MSTLEEAYSQLRFSTAPLGIMQPTFETSIDELLERLRKDRETADLRLNLSIQPNEEPLEPISIDAANVAKTYQERTNRLNTVNNKINALVAEQSKINQGWNDMVQQHDKILLELRSTLPNEKTTDMVVAFETYKNIMDNNLALWNKQVAENISKFNTECDNIESNLNEMRKLIVTGVKELIPEDQIQPNLCPVCFDQQVKVCLVPCGHTVCRKCSADMRLNTCMTCRAFIRERVVMYFSV